MAPASSVDETRTGPEAGAPRSSNRAAIDALVETLPRADALREVIESEEIGLAARDLEHEAVGNGREAQSNRSPIAIALARFDELPVREQTDVHAPVGVGNPRHHRRATVHRDSRDRDPRAV